MNKIINISNNNYYYKNVSQVSFEGSIKIPKILKHNFSKKAEMQMYIHDRLYEIYNRNNYYKSQKENIEYIKLIKELIKSPTVGYLNLLSKYEGSLSLLHRIFKNIDGNKKRLNFVNKVIEIVSKDKSRPEILAEILESPLSSKYINNFKQIKPYLIYNKQNSNAVAELDLLYHQNMFKSSVYEEKLLKEKHKKEFPFFETDILNRDIFDKIYTKPASELAHSISNFFSLSKEMLANGNDKDILCMLKSVNSKNIRLRLSVIDAYSSKFCNSKNLKIDENIIELNKLFEKLDNDKYTRGFVKKTLSNIKYSLSIKELNEMLERIPSRKLNIYSSNVTNILSKVRGEDRFFVLEKEIKNPFFETESSLKKKNLDIEYGYIKKQSKFSILRKKAINYLRILKDNLYKQSSITSNTPVKTNDISVKITEPQNIIEYKSKSSKEIVKEDVVKFVSKKLSKNTFIKQEEAYISNATKIRLSMLSEIFKSVTETRKVDRTVGKLKHNSSKKDVLSLYLKINGNNKKFINYMLKKRNVDGSRMFEIKDIINIINKAELKIAKMKNLNPKYRAKDTKNYYNHLYEAKIEQYGKLKRPIKTY